MRDARLALTLSLALAGACQPYPYPGEEGAVLHVGIRDLPKSFDPPGIEDQGSGYVASHVYDGLLAYHPYARPYALMPSLAEAMPEVSEDRLTYTFRIRRGVRFHDNECFRDGRGREVTAHDFMFAFKRFAHPLTRAKGWWLFDGKVDGLNAWREALQQDIDRAREAGETVTPLWGLEREVSGFRVLDDYTFQFRLAEPYPQFLWVLAMPYASVYPREAVDHYGPEFRNNPVGTGPFVVTEYNPVYRVVYRANATFREVRVPEWRSVSSWRTNRVGSISAPVTPTS
jgi:oligopeptide transport system substrate-binding protein